MQPAARPKDPLPLPRMEDDMSSSASPRRHWTPSLLALLCLCLAGCPDPPSPAVAVEGNYAFHDLGAVPPESAHQVVFVIDNPTDRAVTIQRIGSDCPCTSAVAPPSQLSAGTATNITVRVVSPKAAVAFRTQLILETDDPQRPIIRLEVRSQPNR
jgi:hypothetical protein